LPYSYYSSSPAEPYWKKQSVKSRFGRYLFWSQSCFMKSPTVGWRTGSVIQPLRDLAD